MAKPIPRTLAKNCPEAERLIVAAIAEMQESVRQSHILISDSHAVISEADVLLRKSRGGR